MFQSTVTCKQCSKFSQAYDTFLDISLAIDNLSTLDECLNKFFCGDKIQNSYFCEFCKQNREAVKQMTLAYSPENLVLHLKRFKVGQKLQKLISFPQNLYIRQLIKILIALKLSFQRFQQNLQENSYKLVAIVIHLGGTLTSGHYITYAERNSLWYKFDDSNVTQIDEAKVLTAQAYILFYRKN